MARNSMPTGDNKYFKTVSNGGYSSCIKGKPTHSIYDVLNNCVGWACACFNEACGLGYEKYHLTCNAENWIERAIAMGLSVVKKPVVGGVLVFQKGATLGASDGAGHVAYVYQVDNVENPTVCWTSESGYGSSTSHWNTRRTNTNGKWGAGANYSYRGCIVPPNYVEPSKPDTPDIKPGAVGKFNIGDKVIINGPLYPSSNAGSPTGNASNKVTTITRRNDGSAHPYNTTGDLGWMDESSISKYNEPSPEVKPEPAPNVPETFKVGDKVKPIRLVDYNGTPLKQYDDVYTISELKGNRAVLTAPRNGKAVVWAAMRTEDITHA